MNSPNWAQIATASIAFVALVGAVVQIAVTRNANRRTAALRYFERWSDPEAIPYIAKTASFLTLWSEAEEEARWEQWSAKTVGFEERLETLVFVNFWEELAALYNSRLVDRKVVREYLGDLIVDYWELGSWFIRRVQAKSPTDLQQWENMYWDVKRRLVHRDRPRWPARLRSAMRRGRRLRLERRLQGERPPDELELTLVWKAGRKARLDPRVYVPSRGDQIRNHDGTTAKVVFAQRLTTRRVLVKLRTKSGDPRRLPGLTP